MSGSILSPKTEVRGHSLNGKGTFATADIKKGEMVFIRGGELMRLEEAYNYVKGECPDGVFPVDGEYWLGARTAEDYEKQKVFVNHSCEPNCGMHGQIVCVAMRDIKAGEEITQDYATIDDSDYEMPCTCGAPNCRGVISGRDWQKPEIQAKYQGYFTQYLADKIAKQSSNS